MSKKVTLERKNFVPADAAWFSRRKYQLLQFPFRALTAVGILLVASAGYFVWSSMALEKERLYAEMKSRADVLIWALEGGARSMQRQLAPPPRSFVEEVAKQPYILYMAILDEEGKAFIHSDPDKTGSTLRSKQDLLAVGNEAGVSKGALVTEDGFEQYEVLKVFTPEVMHARRMKGNHGTMMRHRWKDSSDHVNLEGSSKYYVLVSIDPQPFLDGLHRHAWHLFVISSLLVLAGITGLSLLIFVHNYKTSRRLLQDTQAFTLQVFDRLPIGVFTTDTSGNITLSNRVGALILGVQENTQHIISACPMFDWKYFTQSIKEKTPVMDYEYEFTNALGKNMTVSISATAVSVDESEKGDPLGYLFIVRDMGEVKRLQKQVRLNERLTALGNLAAGVAHEIRNPLSTVKGYATYLAGKVNGTAAHATAIHMLEEIERLNRVVSDLLSVAKTGEVSLKESSVESVVSRALRLAASEAENRDIRLIEPNLKDEQHIAILDEDRLLQAFLNLLINAIQASDTGSEVQLTIVEQDDSILVSISDHGKGMDAATLEKLFSPYFTTKPLGTGLGLTITHQIIDQHGGNIRVQSEVNKGTVFTVVLPAFFKEINYEISE